MGFSLGSVSLNRMLQCKVPTVFYASKKVIQREQQFGVLIVKPAAIPNANLCEDNLAGIQQRFMRYGWKTFGFKVWPGEYVDADIVEKHYRKLFIGCEIEDMRRILSPAESLNLQGIYGESNYPLIHAMRLHQEYGLSFEYIGKTWDRGRGPGNSWLEKGLPGGVNRITKKDDPLRHQAGVRRVFLVEPEKNAAQAGMSVVNGGRPFLLVNGFAAELIHWFTRSGERIAVAALVRGKGGADISRIREDCVGVYDPSRARPGSIRNDFLRGKARDIKYPLVSKTDIGIQNNGVHFSDNRDSAEKEYAMWINEIRVEL